MTGVTPVKKFKNPKTAVSRIWDRIQGLGEAAKPAETAKPKAHRKATGGAQGARGAPVKEKTAQVVALLQRKNGATSIEIMEKMGWQRHTVRGFMAGPMKKAG